MSSSVTNEAQRGVESDPTRLSTESAPRPSSPSRAVPVAARLLSSLSDRVPRISSTSPLRDEWQSEEGLSVRVKRRASQWARKRHPKLGWKTPLTSNKRGRLLVVDYVKVELSGEGMRKVASREIHHIEALQKLYSNPNQGDTPVLRLFHVQNADWAVEFLVNKCAIDINDIVGNDFASYVSENQPQTRGGKPMLRGRTWQPLHDPWRGINKIAFGLDYLKLYPSEDTLSRSSKDKISKLMELNSYNQDPDNPRFGWDVCPQRLSFYIQRQEELSDPSEGVDVQSPYTTERPAHSFDNGNVIIIFDNCRTKSVEDTLIQARGSYESRWRRLPFYVAADQHEVSSNEDLALECMKYISQDIWNGLADSWAEFLDHSDHHIAILEEKIYEQPADESRADEIWRNSSNWLKIERLMYIHLGVVKQLNKSLNEYIEDHDGDGWLDDQVETFESLLQRVSENLVKPTNSLSELMYRSVGIRDTRHSLELSYSMWRLSWITFIFLPLNYSTSFFGMNVDIFQGNPPLKWYFIASVPLLLMVFVTYWAFKHYFLQSRQTPYSRGIYERFFAELTERYPSLWSRTGPRSSVKISPFWQRIQWRLIQYWNQPGKTIETLIGREDDQFDGLDTWQHLRKVVTRRWTAELSAVSTINIEPEAQVSYIIPLVETYAKPTTVQNLDQILCETDISSNHELKPTTQPIELQKISSLPNTVTTRGGSGSPRIDRFLNLSTGSKERSGSQGSQGSSAAMVEEHKEDWLCPGSLSTLRLLRRQRSTSMGW